MVGDVLINIRDQLEGGEAGEDSMDFIKRDEVAQ
jgi:hypothetical protein